jgi:hypothetical protein
MKYLVPAGLILAVAASGLFARQITPDTAGRPAIRQRQRTQQKRIGTGVESGQLTAREAARLERKEARLNREIRKDRKDGGGLTARERRKINRRQDRMSRDIYRQKHDKQVQPAPAPPAQ